MNLSKIPLRGLSIATFLMAFLLSNSFVWRGV